MSPDGKMLYVANAKGFGAGPNGGPNFHEGPEGTYIGDITKGVVSVISLPVSFTDRYEVPTTSIPQHLPAEHRAWDERTHVFAPVAPVTGAQALWGNCSGVVQQWFLGRTQRAGPHPADLSHSFRHPGTPA